MAAQEVRYEVKLDGVDNFGKNINTMQGQVNSFESAIGSVGKKLAALFVVDKMIEFGKSIVDVGAKFEAYEIGLGTLLHGEKAAHEAFEQIKKDAQTTPFDTESLLMANRALISSGASAKDARNVVLDLGNAIAATGGGSEELSRMAVNLQQIKSIGHASAMDIKQFAFAGINIYELLAKSTGKNVEEVKKMSVSYDVLSKALKDAHGAGGLYEGGLEKMGKSTQVQLSNIKDTVQFLFVDIFKAVKPAIDAALSAFGSIMGKIKDALPSILETFKPIWGIVKEIAGTLYDIGKVILPELQKMMVPIIELLKMAWSLVKELIKPIQEQLKPVLVYIRELITNIVSVFRELMPILGPIFQLIGAVAGLVIKIAVGIERARMAIYKWIAGFSWVQSVFEAIKTGIGWVIDKIMWAVGKAEQVLSWMGLINDDAKALGIASSASSKLNKEKAEAGIGTGNFAAGGGIPDLKPSSQSDKVTGTKQVTINVTIQKLNGIEKVIVESLNKAGQTAGDAIVKHLLGAVNQFSASADI